MFWIKVRIFYLFLTVLSVGANHLDVSFEQLTTIPNTELPIALQFSTPVTPEKQRLFTGLIKQISEENHIIRKHTDNNLHINDIEVFNDKLGPKMEKQEEEAEEAAVEDAAEPDEEVAEEEAKPEEDEPKEEEPESEPLGDGEVEPEEPKEENTAVEAEEPEPEPEEETPAETPPEEKDETVPEAENETPNEEPAPEGESETAVEEEAAADNADDDMPNDEPAKEEDNVTEKPTDVTEIVVGTDDNDKNKISCFTCTSNDDSKCHKKPTQQTPCPKVNEGQNEKQHGCYTLYETDTNITMRGCVDELAEEGLKYCLTNEKYCELCYQTGCNNKAAPNSAGVQQLNIFALLTTIMALMAIRK